MYSVHALELMALVLVLRILAQTLAVLPPLLIVLTLVLTVLMVLALVPVVLTQNWRYYVSLWKSTAVLTAQTVLGDM